MRPILTALLAAFLLAPAAPATKAASQNKAGVFDYYVLTLTWSPTYCAENRQTRKTPQCDGRRPYAFVLHGLWPQHNSGWPESCWVKDRWVPRDVIDAMLDITPNRGLIIHEWRKHGTCSGLAPRAYFNTARALFDQIKIPARYLTPKSPIYTTPRQIETDFLKTNPQLSEDMIAVSCGRRKRLRELRVCFSKDLKPIACGVNENQRRLCRQRQIIMPPVRGR